jgi:hypothetical protein
MFTNLIKNVFWKVANSDPHLALSFDRLHANHGGMFNHLYTQLKVHVEGLGRAAIKKIDDQYASCMDKYIIMIINIIFIFC